MNVCVINYGAGNLFSLASALKYLGINPLFSDTCGNLLKCDKIILPGVGHFESAILKLRKLQLIDSIQYEILTNKKPILGICLGMQLLTKTSEEGGKVKGLELINLETEALNKMKSDIKLPHIGFNSILFEKPGILYKDLPSKSDFYFNHSYGVLKHTTKATTSICHYNGNFISSFEEDNIFGVQYHPELSQDHGLHVLKNFLEL